MYLPWTAASTACSLFLFPRGTQESWLSHSGSLVCLVLRSMKYSLFYSNGHGRNSEMITSTTCFSCTPECLGAESDSCWHYPGLLFPGVTSEMQQYLTNSYCSTGLQVSPKTSKKSLLTQTCLFPACVNLQCVSCPVHTS